MEAWMGDPVLNENAAVAKWHQSQQKSGFKFLVTQLLGYLTGGPQRYTGVPMEIAHKHLAITTSQWKSFIADAVKVFQKLGTPSELTLFQKLFQTQLKCSDADAATHSELLAILESFQDQCVL